MTNIAICRSRARSRLRLLSISAMIATLASAAAPAAAQQQRSETDNCFIGPSATVKLAAPLAGLVQKVFVDRGDAVRAGQVVAELDADVERASVEVARARTENAHELAAAQSRLAYLERKTDRITRLEEAEAVSEASRDETDTELKLARQEVREAWFNRHVARLEMRRAQALLDQRMIRSPVDGVVLERALSPGEYLNDQAHVMTIIQIRPLHAEVVLPRESFGSLELGEQAEIHPEAPFGSALIAKITVVDPFIDAASGTFGVRLTLDNPDGKIPAGLRCTVRFRERVAGGPQDAG
jgi:RND family efflux transporter MFP subunit